MKWSVWAFLFCALGIVIDSTVIWGTAGILGYVPPGAASRQVTNYLLVPLEVLDILFVLGAIASAYFAIRYRRPIMGKGRKGD